MLLCTKLFFGPALLRQIVVPVFCGVFCFCQGGLPASLFLFSDILSGS
jgi:hypothetical protein